MTKATPSLVPDRPLGIPWEEYEEQLRDKWMSLLDSDPPPEEVVLQEFLERNPSLIPLVEGHHGPSYHAVVTQPRLPGFSAKFPDFMWIAYDSLTAYPNLIEIEAPEKRWFRRDGPPRSELTQALDQLHEWEAWFEEPESILLFRKHYRVRSQPFVGHGISPDFVLVYGRRTDVAVTDGDGSRRRHLPRPGEHLMTYDRLTPDRNLASCITVSVDADGPVAKHVPPTFELNALNMMELVHVAGLEEAIDENEAISPERKSFLKDRLPVWRDAVTTSETVTWSLAVRD